MGLPTKDGKPFTDPTVAPDQIAAKLERLQRLQAGHQGWRQRRKAAITAMAEDLSGLSLDQLRTKIAHRWWVVVLYHLAGLSLNEIARQVGYAKTHNVTLALEQPVVKEYLSRVRAEQERRVLNGEFGVQAAAKNAAPKVMRRIIEKAGGVEDPRTGLPVGQATKDADLLRAAETTLRVSGDLVERKQDLHMHILASLSDEEMAQVANTGRLPDKYGALLNDTLTRDPIDVTPESP